MDNIDISGGVSPLKARQSSRGGKYAKKATSTSRRRGGFAASEGVRGGGGRNVGGYNVRTKFKAAPTWVPPGSSKTVIPPRKTTGQEIIDSTAGEEFQTIKGEKAKTGNEFADNCYDENGAKRQGHVFYSEKKGYDIVCDWDPDHKSTGAFDYDKEATDDKRQRRTWTQKEGEDKIYTDWEDYKEEVVKK